MNGHPATTASSPATVAADPAAEWAHVAVTSHGRGNHAVRDAHWRYIRYADDGEELYDHRRDPHEWTNLAAAPATESDRARLRAYLPATEANSTSGGPGSNGDGGFRPTYNVQFATTAQTQLVAGVDVTNAGTDGGQTTPMLEQIEQRYHQRPAEYLADGGFVNLEALRQAESLDIAVYLPIMEQKQEQEQKRAKGIDPFAPLKGDPAEFACWRARMGTAAAQEIYKQRAASAELTYAWCRNHGLHRFFVRGLEKVKAVALGHALARNFHSMLHLRREQPQPL